MTGLKLIWAQSHDGIIGDGVSMPWHIPEELAHFKEVTLGQTVIMGRKTWDSLSPRYRPLPGRDNIVLSRRDISAPGAIVTDIVPETGWIIGGGVLYRSIIHRADELVVTTVDIHLDTLLGSRAVMAPKIPDDFKVMSETRWYDSDTYRYMITRYQRS